MTATAIQEIIPGWRDDELPLHDKLDRELLVRAYRFSEEAHRGQVRNSGDPYVTHSVEVAKILASFHLDSITVASGSTPSVFTSPSCSTQPRMLLSSGTNRSSSASLIAIRARLAMWRTCSWDTDIAGGR